MSGTLYNIKTHAARLGATVREIFREYHRNSRLPLSVSKLNNVLTFLNVQLSEEELEDLISSYAMDGGINCEKLIEDADSLDPVEFRTTARFGNNKIASDVFKALKRLRAVIDRELVTPYEFFADACNGKLGQIPNEFFLSAVTRLKTRLTSDEVQLIMRTFGEKNLVDCRALVNELESIKLSPGERIELIAAEGAKQRQLESIASIRFEIKGKLEARNEQISNLFPVTSPRFVSPKDFVHKFEMKRIVILPYQLDEILHYYGTENGIDVGRFVKDVKQSDLISSPSK